MLGLCSAHFPAFWHCTPPYSPAFGVASPFVPALLASKGLNANGIGLVLAAGTTIRLVAGPAGGRLADHSSAPRRVLAFFLTAAAVIVLGYHPAYGFLLLLAVSAFEAVALAPVIPIADALTLQAAGGPRRFHYGWVRGAGSAAFVGGTVLSGFAIARFGLPTFIWLNAVRTSASPIFEIRPVTSVSPD